MANDYTSHSRFFFSNYSEIQDGINNGTVNANDIVLCADTQEQILITTNFELKPIKSRVYRFVSVVSAETFLNNATDTYQGQIVSILNTTLGTYQAYMVNKRASGKFYVTAISVYNASDIDYNEIGNRPIEQIGGNIENPALLSAQEDGLYKVEGAFKVAPNLITIFQSYNGDLISVKHNDDGTTNVKVITASSITDYLVNNNGDVIDKGTYVTKEWIESQGYSTTAYLDAKIEAMNLITRDEALEYIEALIAEGINEAVNQAFDDTFNERFDRRLRESLKMEDQENIQGLFS